MTRQQFMFTILATLPFVGKIFKDKIETNWFDGDITEFRIYDRKWHYYNGKWHHFETVCNETNHQIYIDGERQCGQIT